MTNCTRKEKRRHEREGGEGGTVMGDLQSKDSKTLLLVLITSKITDISPTQDKILSMGTIINCRSRSKVNEHTTWDGISKLNENETIDNVDTE